MSNDKMLDSFEKWWKESGWEPHDAKPVAREAWLVAFTAQPATVPEGWQIVPVTPTEDMLARTSWPGCIKTDYAHMLAAAPKPEQQEAPDGLRAMNDSLCDFARRWRMDGDYLRCNMCNRPHLASRADQDFVHVSDCNNSSEKRPWQTLMQILAPLAAAPKPEQQEAPAERECRHCGFLCRPNPAESRKWYPLEQAEPSGNPGEFAAPAGEQGRLTDAEIYKLCSEWGVGALGLVGFCRAVIAADEAKRGGAA